jgi:hypothetical protein
LRVGGDGVTNGDVASGVVSCSSFGNSNDLEDIAMIPGSKLVVLTFDGIVATDQ